MMRFFVLSLSLAGLAIAPALVATKASAAAQIRTQTPCDGFCRSFSGPAPTIPTIRSFVYSAPSAGTAEVTFHGSMLCSNSNAGSNAVVDLATQITNDGGATPKIDGPGGNRFGMTIEAKNPNDRALPVNLASTRVFAVTEGGVQRYFFRMAPLRMDNSTKCIVYNGAFSVVFVP